MLIPSRLYTIGEVMEKCFGTEEQVLQNGYLFDIVFLVLVPETGACHVPKVALSHFMAGDDEYIADAMPEYYSGQPSGKWNIKREKLRILPESWDAFFAPWQLEAGISLAAESRIEAEANAVSGKLTIEVLAQEIAQVLALRNKQRWTAYADDDAMSLTVISTLYKIGDAAKELPGVIPYILKMIRDEKITVRSTRNDVPPIDFEQVESSPERWHMTRVDAQRVKDEMLGETISTAVKLKDKGGRPKINDKKAMILKNLIAAMAIQVSLNTGPLPGSAADLLAACRKIEFEMTKRKANFGGATRETFNTLLKLAGYGMKNGRTLSTEKKYWTLLLPKVMGKIPGDVFG